MSNENKVGTLNISYSDDLNRTIYNIGKTNLAQINKINTLVHSLYHHDESGKGGVKDTSIDGRYTMSIDLSSTGISSLLSGIDGTSLYTFSSNTLIGDVPTYLTLHPIFYKVDEEDTDIHRPNTIYETFVSLIDWVNSQLTTIEATTITGDSCISDCSYTKNFIGQRAFSPTGGVTSGSMLENIEIALCRIEQLKEEILGADFVFKALSEDDCTATSICSLNDKIDALLSIHGGDEYLSDTENADCTISLNADESASIDSCLVKHVDFFSCTEASKYYLDNNNNPVEITKLYDEVFEAFAPNNTSHTIDGRFGNDLDDLFLAGSVLGNNPFGVYPRLSLLRIHNGFVPAVVSQWHWNLNGSHWAGQQSFPWANETPWNITNQRSNLKLNSTFNLNVIYEMEPAQDADPGFVMVLGSDDEVQTYFEIALFGKLPNDRNLCRPVAKYSLSLRSLTNSPFTPKEGTMTLPKGFKIEPGPNKICFLKGISLEDFAWDLGFDAEDFLYSSNGEFNDGHLLTHATVTMVHRAGADPKGYLLDESNDNDTEAYALLASQYGQLYLVGAEIEWLDPGCDEETIGLPVVGNAGMLGMTVDAGNDLDPYQKLLVGADRNSYNVSITDGTMSSSGIALGITEGSASDFIELFLG